MSRAPSRAPSRAERHRSRGERLPPAAELFPPEGHEVANTEGRIGLYCFNFGEVRKAGDVAAQVKNLASAPALVLAGQECTKAVIEGLGDGWLHSDLAYVGDGSFALAPRWPTSSEPTTSIPAHRGQLQKDLRKCLRP